MILSPHRLRADERRFRECCDPSRWRDGRRRLAASIGPFVLAGGALSAIMLAFLASRFWLMTGFTAMASDTRLYGLLARLGVDCGATPYSDFRIEYPPLAWWLIAAPRLVASERYSSPKLSPRLEAEYVAGYQPTFQCEVLVADILCLVMTLLVGGLMSRGARLALPAGYIAITLAQPHLLLDRLDVVLLLLVLGSVYCWLRSLEAFERPGSLGLCELPAVGTRGQFQDHAGVARTVSVVGRLVRAKPGGT